MAKANFHSGTGVIRDSPYQSLSLTHTQIIRRHCKESECGEIICSRWIHDSHTFAPPRGRLLCMHLEMINVTIVVTVEPPPALRYSAIFNKCKLSEHARTYSPLHHLPRSHADIDGRLITGLTAATLPSRIDSSSEDESQAVYLISRALAATVRRVSVKDL